MQHDLQPKSITFPFILSTVSWYHYLQLQWLWNHHSGLVSEVRGVTFIQKWNGWVPLFDMYKRASSSTEAVDAVTNCKRNGRLCIGPFNLISILSCPAAYLFALVATRSEWMLSMILGLLYLIFAFGFAK